MTARRPVIGMSAAVERVQSGAWNDVDVLLPLAYSQAVQRAGGLALLLPPDEAAVSAPDEVLDLVDGLLLAGGSDIDPSTYGAEPDPETGEPYPPRDRFEIALTRRALERDMPVLGVCRGMQLLNVACGGTLIQHLEQVARHRHTPGAFGDHGVVLEPGSLAARAIGDVRSTVKSHHHQGVDRLGQRLVVTGHSEEDGLIEAIEIPGRRFVLGVLWHPEEDERSRVVGALVEAARSHALREAA